MYIVETIGAILKCNIAGAKQFIWIKALFKLSSYQRLIANLQRTRVQYAFSIIEAVIGLMSVYMVGSMIVLAGNTLRHGILALALGFMPIVVMVLLAALGIGFLRISRTSISSVIQLVLVVWFGLLFVQELVLILTFMELIRVSVITSVLCLAGHLLKMMSCASMIGVILSATRVEE